MSILSFKPDWQNIETVLLDMDGTILDLEYDNYFWLEYIPSMYAEKNRTSLEDAKHYVINAIQDKRGTLEWYCTDYWSETLELNIKQLKHETRHLIKLLDNTTEFLRWVANNKRVIMATNSHRDGLEVKLAQSGIGQYFDEMVTSHDYGYPKEHHSFWLHLCEEHNIDKRSSLFADDNYDVLLSAQKFGIAYLAGIKQDQFGNVPHLNSLLAHN